MRSYQLILVLRPGISDSAKKKLDESLKTWLKNVKIVKEESWGEKTLSYKIKKENKGIFLNYLLETDEVIATDFEKRLINTEEVLRHLLVRIKGKVESKEPEKKVKEETKEEKEKKETKKETKTKVKKETKKTSKKK